MFLQPNGYWPAAPRPQVLSGVAVLVERPAFHAPGDIPRSVQVMAMWVLPWPPVFGGAVVRFQHGAFAFSGRLGLATRGGAASPSGSHIALVVVSRDVRDNDAFCGMMRVSDPLIITFVCVATTVIPTSAVALMPFTFTIFSSPDSSITIVAAIATRVDE